MNDVIGIIFKIVIAAILAIITKYLLPYIKSKYDDVRWNRLIDMVQVAVEAAEQTIHEKGEVKKEDVVMFVTNWLNTNDIKVTDKEIDRLIEAAVYKMNTTRK